MTTYNFCAGPAALPKPVLQQAQEELLDWQGLGVSVMEISHRSSEYQSMANQAVLDFRQLLNIGDSHEVLFLHGGASLQFSNIPMTLMKSNSEAEYLVNGIWSEKAAKEAARFGPVNAIDIVEKDPNGLRHIVDLNTVNRSSSPSYTHYTPNETIEGIRIGNIPKTSNPLIADFSSSILSEAINVNKFDLIYAGAQKNIGPAGMTIVIVKKSLFEEMKFDGLPKAFNYKEQAEQQSMINTPATYTWYLASLVFKWLLTQGGVESMENSALEKSKLLYSAIDSDDFYWNPIDKNDRSRMNVPFILKDSSLNNKFLDEAKASNLVGLGGHRSVGGMRASLYNAMPIEGVQALVDFMNEFKRRYG